MRIFAILTLIFGYICWGAAPAETEDIYKTSKELRHEENVEEGVKPVPNIPVKKRTTKLKPEVSCTMDNGERVFKSDARFEQCLVSLKKPTLIKGK